MKRFLSWLIIVLFLTTLIGCSKTSPTPVTPNEPEVLAYVPQDIFNRVFNPYGDVAFPENYKIFYAHITVGVEKHEGKSFFKLGMTASGDTNESIIFIANLAEISEDEASKCKSDYNAGGFCEFINKDGTIFTIRKTNANDDRYEYVDGCLIEITTTVDDENIEELRRLTQNNYNERAISVLVDHLSAKPEWNSFEFGVFLHKQQAQTSVLLKTSDVENIEDYVENNSEYDWYDNDNHRMQITYGQMINEITFDIDGEAIYVTQSSDVFDSALSEYEAPAVSLTKLGFGFNQDGVCGVYQEHEPHYMNVAVHRPEWGEFNEDWNLEYLDEINGYGLRITYNLAIDQYHIMVDKKGTSAGFDYLPSTNTYFGEYPDIDTVKKSFNEAFGTQDTEFYDKPMAQFETVVLDRFGLTLDELYALPKK